MFRKGLRAVFAEASLVRKAKSKGEPFRGWKNTRAHLNRDNGIVFDDVEKVSIPSRGGFICLARRGRGGRRRRQGNLLEGWRCVYLEAMPRSDRRFDSRWRVHRAVQRIFASLRGVQPLHLYRAVTRFRSPVFGRSNPIPNDVFRAFSCQPPPPTTPLFLCFFLPVVLHQTQRDEMLFFLPSFLPIRIAFLHFSIWLFNDFSFKGEWRTGEMIWKVRFLSRVVKCVYRTVYLLFQRNGWKDDRFLLNLTFSLNLTVVDLFVVQFYFY